VELELDVFLTQARDGGELSASRPGRFTSGERASDTYWIGGWVSPRAGLDAVTRKIPSLCQEWNPGHPARSVVTIMTGLPRLLVTISIRLLINLFYFISF